MITTIILFVHIEDEIVEYHKTKLLDMARFKHLENGNENNVPTVISYLWDDTVAAHPSTKHICCEENDLLFNISQRAKDYLLG